MPRLNRLVGCFLGGITLMWQHAAMGEQTTRWTHFGVRPLAMGNAFVAVADDYNALFYNPAGLARLKDWDFEIFNPTVTMSKSTRDLAKKVQDLTSSNKDSSSSGKSQQTKDTLNLFDTTSGAHQYGSIGLTPHFVMKHFGIGIGLDVQASMTFHRYPSADIELGPQVIAPIGLAFNFLEDRLSVGVGVKYRIKGGVDHEFSIQDIDALKKGSGDDKSQPDIEDYVNGGSGLGADVGILFTPVKTMEPTLGISITDVGGTPYKKYDVAGTALGTPDQELASINVGMSLKPLQAGPLYLLTAIDMHGINLPYSFSKKFNLGTELGIGSFVKIQAGLHHGYLTGGLQLDIGVFALRLATYAEEIGSVAGTNEDRRYALQIKFLI